MGNKITNQELIKKMPICVNCVHAYVCEEYNLNRDMLRKRCAYHNDHFLDIEQHKKKVSKETAEKIFAYVNCFGTHNWERFKNFLKQFGVNLGEDK